MSFDWRREYRRQHGPLPGEDEEPNVAPAEAPPANPPAPDISAISKFAWAVDAERAAIVRFLRDLATASGEHLAAVELEDAARSIAAGEHFAAGGPDPDAEVASGDDARDVAENDDTPFEIAPGRTVNRAAARKLGLLS